MDNLFLSEVGLSGYKSIKDVKVEFKRGLNIIIGKNAAGKTNFLKFLHKSLILDYKDLNSFSTGLNFNNGKSISINTEREIEIEDIFSQDNSDIDIKFKISNKEIKDKKGQKISLSKKLSENNIVFDSTFLCHGVPKNYPVIDTPFSFRSDGKNVSNDLWKMIRSKNEPYFLRSFSIELVLILLKTEVSDIKGLKRNLRNLFSEFEKLKEVLKLYSPIDDIRFNDNYNLYVDEESNEVSINNVFIEFKIDGNWLPFSNLSDGTKRLFYIISEIHELEILGAVRPATADGFYGLKEISRVVLIEEPELGIHPHQFHKLMAFLKEESTRKQIIISTHSPQALDNISQDELDRIIIAYSISNKEGTKLRHLNEAELFKAKEYIKEDFLSDYWLYSDLEK